MPRYLAFYDGGGRTGRTFGNRAACFLRGILPSSRQFDSNSHDEMQPGYIVSANGHWWMKPLDTGYVLLVGGRQCDPSRGPSRNQIMERLGMG